MSPETQNTESSQQETYCADPSEEWQLVGSIELLEDLEDDKEEAARRSRNHRIKQRFE